jgi:hypothetical protein
MIIQFSEAELNQLTIQPVERRERSAAYIAEREQVWTGQMETVQARGGQMWNGEVYTFEEILCTGEEQITLRASTCEYKDLVFRKRMGKNYILRQYGEDHLCHYSGVNCVPVTRDGKYIFGIRADQPEQGTPPVGGIGGTLNKDEMEIHSFADIRQCILREIQEETALECTAESLRLFGLYGASYSYNFWFTVRLAIHSEEINQYHRPGEFSSLLAVTQSEALNLSMPMTIGFRRWQPYLHLLPDLLA